MQRDHMLGWLPALKAVDAPTESKVKGKPVPMKAPMSSSEQHKRRRLDFEETLRISTESSKAVAKKSKTVAEEAEEVIDELLEMLKASKRGRPPETGWYVANYCPEGRKPDARTFGKVVRHWDAIAQRWSMAMPIEVSRRRYSVRGYMQRQGSTYSQIELQQGMVWLRAATEKEIGE
jgi:hypothetical protein